MKWCTYVWISFRFLIFVVLYNIIISLCLSFLLGVFILIKEGIPNTTDEAALGIVENMLVFWISIVISLISAGALSGWQHFRYYKRKQDDYSVVENSQAPV